MDTLTDETDVLTHQILTEMGILETSSLDTPIEPQPQPQPMYTRVLFKLPVNRRPILLEPSDDEWLSRDPATLVGNEVDKVARIRKLRDAAKNTMSFEERKLAAGYRPMPTNFKSPNSISTRSLRDELNNRAVSIPADYFKGDMFGQNGVSIMASSASDQSREIISVSDRLLSLPLAKKYEITLKDIAINAGNEDQVAIFLSQDSSKTFGLVTVKPWSIPAGIIGGNDDMLILVGSPNAITGQPGQLLAIFKDNNDRITNNTSVPVYDPFDVVVDEPVIPTLPIVEFAPEPAVECDLPTVYSDEGLLRQYLTGTIRYFRVQTIRVCHRIIDYLS